MANVRGPETTTDEISLAVLRTLVRMERHGSLLESRMLSLELCFSHRNVQ